MGKDIFLYFGLGCRNVSKLYLPKNFDVREILPHLESWSWLGDHHKYRNNYDYNKSILLVNRVDHYDNGFLLLKESPQLVSQVSVLNYEYYNNTDELKDHLVDNKEDIQCVVSNDDALDDAVSIGDAQFPKLWDYADGVDTMDFLTKL